jgi:hypothetical protein
MRLNPAITGPTAGKFYSVAVTPHQPTKGQRSLIFSTAENLPPGRLRAFVDFNILVSIFKEVLCSIFFVVEGWEGWHVLITIFGLFSTFRSI